MSIHKSCCEYLADAVIVNYRETELGFHHFEQGSLACSALERVRNSISKQFGPINKWLPPHVIDLREGDGIIQPHIDSVKFSGDIVAGLSLVSPSTMTLARADKDTGKVLPDADAHTILLEPKSLYLLSGPARFSYAHSINKIEGHRLSIIFRDDVPTKESSTRI